MENGLFNNFESLKKPITYLMVSVITTIVDIGFLIILIELVGLYYLFAASISFSIALITKFSLSKYFVFQSRPGNWITQFRKFFTVSLNGMILTNIFMFIGVDILDQPYLYSKLVIVIIIFMYTLFFHNFYSFSKKGNQLG